MAKDLELNRKEINTDKASIRSNFEVISNSIKENKRKYKEKGEKYYAEIKVR